MYTLKQPFLGEISGGEQEFKSADKEFLRSAEDSLFSLCLALRRLPNITHSSSSRLSHKIADNLHTRLEREYSQNHKDYLSENLELVLFDRRDDPITPLIYNWSYMSLVHEFIGISANTVNIAAKGHIFARGTDDFFLDANWASNYGELTRDLHSHLERLKKTSGGSKKLQTVAEMEEALSKMPEGNKELATIQKHSEICAEIQRVVEARDLYEVSQLQQDIIVENNKAQQFKDLQSLFNKKNVTQQDKIKLACLFCLKYSDDSERVAGIKRALSVQNIDPDVVGAVCEYSSSSRRVPAELFSRVGDLMEKVNFESIFSKFKEEEKNIYERYQPKVVEVVTQLLKGKLKKTEYITKTLNKFEDIKKDGKKNVLVFIVGGVTYQEGRELHKAGLKGGFDVIVGANNLLNSEEFLNQLRKSNAPKKDPPLADESDGLLKKLA